MLNAVVQAHSTSNPASGDYGWDRKDLTVPLEIKDNSGTAQRGWPVKRRSAAMASWPARRGAPPGRFRRIRAAVARHDPEGSNFIAPWPAEHAAGSYVGRRPGIAYGRGTLTAWLVWRTATPGVEILQPSIYYVAFCREEEGRDVSHVSNEVKVDIRWTCVTHVSGGYRLVYQQDRALRIRMALTLRSEPVFDIGNNN